MFHFQQQTKKLCTVATNTKVLLCMIIYTCIAVFVKLSESNIYDLIFMQIEKKYLYFKMLPSAMGGCDPARGSGQIFGRVGKIWRKNC